MLYAWIVCGVFAILTFGHLMFRSIKMLDGPASRGFETMKSGMLWHILLSGITAISFIVALILTILHFVK